MAQNANSSSVEPKNRMATTLLASILGSFGIHQFYLGNTGSGIARILITATIIGWPVSYLFGLIEAVKYVTMTDENFHHIYVEGDKSWF